MSPIPVAGGRASTSFWAGPSRPFAGWRPDRMTPPVALSQLDVQQGSEPEPARVSGDLGRMLASPGDAPVILPVARAVLAPQEPVELKLMTRRLLRAATRGG